MIFTAPSSARGNLDAEEVPEPRRRPQKKMPSKRPPVADQLRMDGKVTPRAIAYAAVQVHHSPSFLSLAHTLPKLHFALNDATHWMVHYNGFNYEEFYEFIVDFFEDDQTPEGKAATAELLNWWNRYVIIPNASSLRFTPPQTCVSTVRCHTCRLIRIRRAKVACSCASTAPSTQPVIPPVSAYLPRLALVYRFL